MKTGQDACWYNIGVTRAMTRLARLPQRRAMATGLAILTLLVLLDGASRSAGLRLVPLYVPLLCVMSWVLKRRWALWFAIAAAIIALLPDIAAAPARSGAATAANMLIRAATYIFLALIIVAYRRAYDEADFRAMYDGLTGTLNKLPFQSAAVRHLSAARRARQTMLAVCVDLDGFKAINTSYGHAAGDAALRAFAQEAMSAIRGSDLVGRLGGDEFGFLLTAPPEHGAEGLVHLLHQRLSDMLTKTGLPLSCSMGALIVPAHAALSAADLFDRADALMRRAKADGKSRVIAEILRD